MRRVTFGTAFVFGLAGFAAADTAQLQWFHDLSDLSIYVKPRFSTPNQWDQQFGIRAKLLRYGNFSAEYSLAYDPFYPVKFNTEPRWTTGIQFAYFFVRAPIPIAVYTTPKYNLYNQWKEEFGLNFRIVSKPRYYISSSLDYQVPYPYAEKSKPVFQASLTLGFPLGG